MSADNVGGFKRIARKFSNGSVSSGAPLGTLIAEAFAYQALYGHYLVPTFCPALKPIVSAEMGCGSVMPGAAQAIRAETAPKIGNGAFRSGHEEFAQSLFAGRTKQSAVEARDFCGRTVGRVDGV
jgi:hypothetical protein